MEIKKRGELKKGERKFIKEYKEIVSSEKSLNLPPEQIQEKVRYTVENIKEKIKNLPEIIKEEELHQTSPALQMTNILSQTISIALNEGLEKGFKFIYKTNNPFLIDAFHDIIIGHFVDLINKQQKK